MSGIAKLSGLFWSTVQPRVAQWTRTCSYDRAGSGFSSAGLMPRTSTRIAVKLHDALHNAGIRGPYIFAGRALLDSHAAPAASCSDTEPRRGEIRGGLQDVLKKLESGH